MKDSVIFLDIDGVLNSKKYCDEMFEKTQRCRRNELKPNSLVREMDPEIIKRVAQLADITNSSVVLSSSWKHIWQDDSDSLGKADMTEMFELNGLHVEEETTPNAKSGSRPLEIKTFLEQHPEVQHWVSLDDDYSPYQYAKVGLAKNVVKTKYDNKDKYGGFSEEHFAQAYGVLQR